jgi:hypothetical protein
MTLSARLITPKGEIIELTPETYRRVRKLVVSSRPKRITSRFIHSTYGKYASRPSMTKALLAQRAADLALEEAKIKRWHGRK